MVLVLILSARKMPFWVGVGAGVVGGRGKREKFSRGTSGYQEKDEWVFTQQTEQGPVILGLVI